MDPAMTAYLLGEMARRCGEPAAAPVWFAASDLIIDSQLTQLEEEEKAAVVKAAEAGIKPPKTLLDRADSLHERWNLLRENVIEQRSQAKFAEGLDPNIRTVLNEVLKAAGLDPAKFKMPDAAATADMLKMQDPAVAKQNPNAENINATPPAKPLTPEIPKLASSGKIQTRDQLYTMYYDAINRYINDKKSNPTNLLALVKEGYVVPEDSCLDAKGNLFCPKTKEQLLYMRGFKLGSETDQIIFPMKNKLTTKILYADGKAKSLQPQDE